MDAVDRAKEIFTAVEWEGDMRVNMTKVIGAGRVMAKRIEELETMRLELLTALIECQDYDELYERCMELVEE